MHISFRHHPGIIKIYIQFILKYYSAAFRYKYTWTNFYVLYTNIIKSSCNAFNFGYYGLLINIHTFLFFFYTINFWVHIPITLLGCLATSITRFNPVLMNIIVQVNFATVMHIAKCKWINYNKIRLIKM